MDSDRSRFTLFRSLTVWQTLGCSAIVGFVVTCSAGRESEIVRTAQRSPPSTATRPAPPWPHFEATRAWPVVTRAFRSTHWTPERSAVVRVEESNRAAYVSLTRGSTLPVGARVMEELAAAPNAPASAYFVMEKTSADQWRYLELDRSGAIVANDENGLCRRCHAEAVSDALFGVGDNGLDAANATPSNVTQLEHQGPPTN